MQHLAAEKRNISGKKVADLRKKGFLPAVMYGGKGGSENITLPFNDFMRVWRAAGESTLVELEINGSGKKSVLIQDVSVDPIESRPLHVDFLEVATNRPIKAGVQFVFEGESDAVKALGGVLVKVMHEVEVEALPKDLPHEIVIDISALATFDDVILVKNIKVSSGVTIHAAADSLIAKVTPPRAEEEATETPVDLENIEVVKKGKKEEEATDADSATSE